MSEYQFKGTPGPWKAREPQYKSQDGVPKYTMSIYGEYGAHICDKVCTKPYVNLSIANARLIAAAPDLLEACVLSLRYIDKMLCSTPNGFWHFDNDAHVALQQAIHKALNHNP